MALRKAKNTLEFDLRLQEFIELVREGNNMDAIAYSTKYLAPWSDSAAHRKQITQACTLLAFPPSTTCGPYKVSSSVASSVMQVDLVCIAFVRFRSMGRFSQVLPSSGL